MKNDNVLVAISKKEDSVFLVKNVSNNEYNALLNNQSAKEQSDLDKEHRFKKHLDQHDADIKHLYKHELILAKSVYDNFVDRGLLENDEDFQKLWFDYYFNDGELDLENAPEEYKKILAKLGELK